MAFYSGEFYYEVADDLVTNTSFVDFGEFLAAECV